MKRLFCAIMTMAMVLSTIQAFTGVAFAGTVSSKQLENAITAAKAVVTIPESLSEFEYHYDEKSEGKSQIVLNWSDEEDEGNISVSVDTAGNILSYYAGLPEFESTGLSKITKEQAEKVAKESLEKFLPKSAGVFKLQDSVAEDYGDAYSFSYRMYKNEIPCDFVNANVSINKYAGKLSNYRFNGNIEDLSKAYPSADQVISADDAKKAYIAELGPSLKYLSYYDYEKKSMKVYAAYKSEENNKAIDAKTGKVVSRYRDIIAYGGMANKDAATEEAGGSGGARAKFTEQELKEIETTESLIDKAQADKIARELVGISSGEKLEEATLNKQDYPNQEYEWYLGYDTYYVQLNAKNGSLNSFYNTNSKDAQDKRDIGSEKAKAIADGYLDKVCSDKKTEVKWTNEDAQTPMYNGYSYVYTRQVNGIDVEDNTINIVVDQATGKINSYRKTWYNHVTFPDLKGAMTAEAAFDKVAALGEFGMMYQKSGEKEKEGTIQLVYNFKNGSNYVLDAFKGVRLDYRGNVYREAQAYSDIAGHWAEKTINELMNNGYYLEGDKFLPKAATTQLEFFKYLYAPQQSWYNSEEEFYDMLVRSKIITKEEINGEAYITRQDAAKFAVRYLGLDKLAKNPNIFKNMYADNINQAYLGYAATAYGMGLMKGDAKGRFNGSATMNHAETACLIYNTLNSADN